MTPRTAADTLASTHALMEAGVPPPRCQHWHLENPPATWPAKQCDALTDGLLSTPDGDRGFAYCAEHGMAIHTEYRDKLGETWPWLPFMDYATDERAGLAVYG